MGLYFHIRISGNTQLKWLLLHTTAELKQTWILHEGFATVTPTRTMLGVLQPAGLKHERSTPANAGLSVGALHRDHAGARTTSATVANGKGGNVNILQSELIGCAWKIPVIPNYVYLPKH